LNSQSNGFELQYGAHLFPLQTIGKCGILGLDFAHANLLASILVILSQKPQTRKGKENKYGVQQK
jgi:hypothetical protein